MGEYDNVILGFHGNNWWLFSGFMIFSCQTFLIWAVRITKKKKKEHEKENEKENEKRKRNEKWIKEKNWRYRTILHAIGSNGEADANDGAGKDIVPVMGVIQQSCKR